MPEGREECRKRKVARRPGRAQRGTPSYGGYSPIYVEGRESLRSKPAERSEVLLLTERGPGVTSLWFLLLWGPLTPGDSL